MNNILPPPRLASGSSSVAFSAHDAIQAIDSWSDLSSTKRRDLRSTLSTIAKWLAVPPSDLPLTPEFLRLHIMDCPPGHFGVSLGRMRNIKSDLRAILRRLNVIDKARGPVAATWGAVLAHLDPKTQVTLKQLAAYCTTRGIQPMAVAAETMEAFEAQLRERTLCRNPRNIASRTRGLVTRLALAYPGLIAPQGTRSDAAGQYVLPLDRFSASFQADVAAFGRHLAGEGARRTPSDDEAPLPNFRPQRPSTVAGRMGHARWAASALVAAGVPVSEIVDLRSLVQPVDRAGMIFDFLAERADGEASSAGTHVADVLRIIARHYAPLPERDVKQIIAWGKPLRLVYKGMTPKNQRTVREVLSPECEWKLLNLPDALLKRAGDLRAANPKTAANSAMRALAIEFELRTQMRLSNLIGILMHRHIHRPTPGGRAEFWIDIPAGESKNDHGLNFPLPAETARKLQIWIDIYRPILAPPGSPYLFPGAKRIDQPITPQAMRSAIKTSMKAYVGVVTTPQQFRHIAAKQFLREYPGHYDEVRLMLGHTSTETTIRHYSGIEGESAHRRYDDLLRQRSRLLTPRPPRRDKR
jgi:integrase